jgi:hypothetical protein
MITATSSTATTRRFDNLLVGIAFGIVLTILLGVLTVTHLLNYRSGAVLLVGIYQVIYVVPIMLYLRKLGFRRTARGILYVAALLAVFSVSVVALTGMGIVLA